jgi:hypothetical protein
MYRACGNYVRYRGHHWRGYDLDPKGGVLRLPVITEKRPEGRVTLREEAPVSHYGKQQALEGRSGADTMR